MTHKEVSKFLKGAAFPQILESEDGPVATKGLTKREYFAAMAMQGLLANRTTSDVFKVDVAIWSVQQADALIKALNEIQP